MKTKISTKRLVLTVVQLVFTSFLMCLWAIIIVHIENWLIPTAITMALLIMFFYISETSITVVVLNKDDLEKDDTVKITDLGNEFNADDYDKS
jgi:hypothetical protein